MNQFVNSSEKTLFVATLAISIIFYLLMIISVVGIIYLLVFGFIALAAHAIFLGGIRGNGIKVTPKQFPELYQEIEKISRKIELNAPPDVYIIQGGGLLNAFATKLFSRNFVILYADILEMAYDEGEAAVHFVLAHELAHIKCKHVSRQWLLLPGMMIPFLGTAYSRACEYTCDQIAAHCSPQGAVSGLLALAVGTKLYKQVDVRDYLLHGNNEEGFWLWLTEKLSTHPFLFKRVQAVQNAVQLELYTTSQVEQASVL